MPLTTSPSSPGACAPHPAGRLRPGINEDPVTIERIEYEIVERAWDEGWVGPQLPTVRTGKSIAVVGSGPPAWRRPSRSRGPATW